MRLYDSFSGYHSFFVCGDIHGGFKTLFYGIKRKEISNAVILLAGDYGIGFERDIFIGFLNIIDNQLFNSVPKAQNRY